MSVYKNYNPKYYKCKCGTSDYKFWWMPRYSYTFDENNKTIVHFDKYVLQLGKKKYNRPVLNFCPTCGIKLPISIDEIQN